MQSYLLTPMKRLMSKPVPAVTKSGHGSLSQERSPNGGRNCSPTNPLSPGQPVALWLSFIIHRIQAGLQFVRRRNVIDMMPYITTKTQGRGYLCRGLCLWSNVRRDDLRGNFPPILADIAEDKERSPVFLLQIP